MAHYLSPVLDCFSSGGVVLLHPKASMLCMNSLAMIRWCVASLRSHHELHSSGWWSGIQARLRDPPSCSGLGTIIKPGPTPLPEAELHDISRVSSSSESSIHSTWCRRTTSNRTGLTLEPVVQRPGLPGLLLHTSLPFCRGSEVYGRITRFGR